MVDQITRKTNKVSTPLISTGWRTLKKKHFKKSINPLLKTTPLGSAADNSPAQGKKNQTIPGGVETIVVQVNRQTAVSYDYAKFFGRFLSLDLVDFQHHNYGTVNCRNEIKSCWEANMSSVYRSVERRAQRQRSFHLSKVFLMEHRDLLEDHRTKTTHALLFDSPIC